MTDVSHKQPEQIIKNICCCLSDSELACDNPEEQIAEQGLGSPVNSIVTKYTPEKLNTRTVAAPWREFFRWTH